MANPKQPRFSEESNIDPAQGSNQKAIAPGEGRGEDPREVTRSSPGTVVVACKIPNGIILQLSHPEQVSEPVMGGGHRDVKVFKKEGDTYTVRGPRVPFGQIPTFMLAGGFALTHGIPADFWDQWLEQNKNSVMVRRGLIMAHKSVDYVQDYCRDNASLLTGLEPIDPNNLPRGLQTADEQGVRSRNNSIRL